MVGSDRNSTRWKGSAIEIALLALALLLGSVSAAQAQDCSDFGGVLDGSAGDIPPAQLQIDQNCTIRNYPASNPLPTNFSFFTQPGQTDERYLVIFDNVVHTGNMSCNATHEHKIWFTNGSSSKIKQNCQNLLIPVEKIDKRNPAGQTTAAIGVPFTYTLTIPVLFDPATGGVIQTDGSVNELHSIRITDDLNETGADLTYLSHSVYWLNGGAPIPHTFTNSGGLLSFDLGPLVIPAGEQIVIELTVVLDDTVANVPGSQFVNTAKWQFGRLIDDVFFEPLPGEWGITEPLTIAAPELVMTKSGPATLGRTLNLGEVGEFTLDIQNTGLSDAWNVTILDQLPDGATGGMCDTTPTVLSVQVFESDGTTPVSGPLVEGSDFSLSYVGGPTCELTLSMLTAAGVIAPDERLIIHYQTKLDSDSQDAVVLTNVAGAAEWFNGDPGNPDRVTFTRVLTDGTPGVSDHEDAHSVAVELDGYFFEKSVENLTSGVSPTTTAAPGDTLRYTLRLQATQFPLDDLTFQDDLGLLNAIAVFVPGSLSVVSVPAGADASNTDPNGGTNGAGLLDVRNIDVPAFSDVEVVFDITVDPGVVDGTIVLNQADLVNEGAKIADSDDPNVNGQADPDVAGDEDPTQVLIAELPVGPLVKAETQATATIGEAFTYQITVPETPHPIDLYDVRISDDLSASAADLRFLGVTKISGSEPWTPVNTGSDTNLVIEDTSIGIDIPAGEQIAVEITVVLEDTPTNVAGLVFTNSASFVFRTIDGDGDSQRPGDQGTSGPMTVVEPDLTMTKSGPPQMTLGIPETFTLDVQNTGDSPAHQLTISDRLPDGADGGTCDAAPTVLSAQVFQADGTTPVSGALSAGADFTTSFSGAPGCLWTLTFTSAQTAIGAGERLILSYETEIDADTQDGVALTNVAGATEWHSTDGSDPDTAADRRTYTRLLTDGTVGVLDHEDAHSVGVALPAYLFEKTAIDPGTGTPITTAAPGDTLRYRLRLENIGDPDFVDLDFSDELDALNASPAFVPGTLTLVTVPAGADTSGTDPNGGAQGTGLLSIADLTASTGEVLVIEFDITLASTLVDGTVVTNQSQLELNGALFTVSDDPNVNGAADPFVEGDEDPTQVLIVVPAANGLQKENTQATATIGEAFSYRITVPETPFAYPMYDVRITDDLTASAANLRFLDVAKTSGSEPWTPVNTGTDTNLVIEDTSIGIDIPAGEQIVIEITVVLEDGSPNTAGLAFTNTADYSFNFADGDDTSQLPGGPGTTPPMTIVEPNVTMAKSGPAQMVVGSPGTFTLDIQNVGGSPAYEVRISDRLPDGATGGMCDTAPTVQTAQVFQADGTTPVSGALALGVDFTAAFAPAPTCLWTLVFTSAQTAVGAGERLIVTYEAELDVDTQAAALLTNVAGATRWFSTDGSDPRTADDRHTYFEVLTDGTVSTLDHEDAHTVGTDLPDYLFEKTVTNLTTGASPAATASPGDTLRYLLRLVNRGSTVLSGLSIQDELDRLNSPPAFEPGTLQLLTVPAGADTSGTSATGGAQGTGLVDVRDLAVGVGETLVIEFDVTLAGVLTNGSVVGNQSQLLVNGAPFAESDDPNINGPADPSVDGDEDPTQVVIESMPEFRVQKVSAYTDGDPSLLLAGERIRYTITVKNVGSADATDATLRDAIPVNTQYVPGSTTLNGDPVPDGPGGGSPLSGGIALHAPEDPTPGAMRADASATASNVATVVFDVVVDAGVADGTVISNQAFVNAVTGGVSDQPSDDPRTDLPDDPTRDVVGNAPLLFAPKSAELLVDAGSPGIVDPGDVLLYTISVQNTGNVDATDAVLTDAVPANTTYVADTTTLNGLPVGQPDGGDFPLAAGLPISSSDLTPPLPGPGGGTVTAGQSAVVQFQLQVDAGVPSGTIISNQAVIDTAELPDLLTDGDGDPDTGPEPTQVVVGDAQQLSITKQVSVVGGGPALAGSELEYVVRVTNIASVPAQDVAITDDLDVPTPGQLAYVAGSATLDGSTTGVAAAGSLITADYSSSYGPLEPGDSTTLRFRATIDPGLANGTTVTNVGVVTWNDPPQSEDASVSVQVGGMPGVAALSGALWHDADFDRSQGGGEIALQDWTVELLRNGTSLVTVQADAGGAWQIGGLAPNDTSGDSYALRFAAPDAGAASAALGVADSPFTNGLQQIQDIVVGSGSNVENLNLPISPNGVVYSALERTPVPGATLTLLDAGGNVALPATCFDDPVQQGQVTRGDGYYRFDLNFSEAACPSGGSYLLAVAPPGPDFDTGVSQIIPPTSGAGTPPLSVPGCPGTPDDAVPATAQHCESQPQELAPPPSVPARSAGTIYHLHLAFDGSQPPGTSQIFNNHIPLDPVLGDEIAITKTTPQRNVSRGQLVPYAITVHNQLAAEILDLSVVDRFPPGFRYVDGSARVDGVPVEPTSDGRELTWTDVGVPASGQRELLLLLAVGAGVTEGEFTNRAQAFSSATQTALTGEAQATVRVVPDPTFDCTDVLGKVFDDADRDGGQGPGERGLQGVRVATARGLVATSDEHGRFHITCAVVPREDRGSNFVLKLDDRTLPTGYRMTTRQVQVKRATRGKALRFQFGASLLRVVGLDLADPVFEPDTAAMRPQWRPRLPLLIAELAKEPAILRLSYVADVEDEALVERRLEAVKAEIAEAWQALDREPLTIETEIFWRRGGPPGARRGGLGGALEALLPSVDAGPPLRAARAGESAERHLPAEAPHQQWVHDPELLETELGDRIEEREVVSDTVTTVKLKGLVPPIHFESGVAQIPPPTIQKLRRVLDGMRHLANVRLHLVGHADDQPLSPRLSGVYGDNQGLSRERAGEAAEFIQTALGLPPESISFSWAGDSEPIASNATAAGRARNRRVEVEVWYDEIEAQARLEEVLVAQDWKRVKVCRTETVCRLRYLEGHQRRARVKNLVAPLHFSEGSVEVPADFVRQVGGTLHNLRGESGVTVRFIGYSDDQPLEGRAERIYGTPLALSKAQAHRVALAVQDALDLPSSAVASDGRGAARPLASNDTARGRALNRRVEVEFAYDDVLAELSDEPQQCPDAGSAEVVTVVYDPPWGRLAPLPIENGEPRIPEDLLRDARRALDEVSDRTRPRLRFVGYTKGERLDRRTAAVYGDDVGLSTARARRAMGAVALALGLRTEQAEHEGRGYVHSHDVVNAGFLQGESSFVAVEVVYDELAALDGLEGVEVTPLTRELRPQNPLSLNLMRITVDGEPLDDPGRSSADIQRCTDVALDRADIRFRFDGLGGEPRLSVSSERPAVSETQPIRFRSYTNYAHYIERSEVRVFERGASLRSQPLAVLEVGADGLAEWQPEAGPVPAPKRDLVFVLRAYDAKGRFDETAPQTLWWTPGAAPTASAEAPGEPPAGDPLLAGYGESGPLERQIPLGNVGSVKVDGRGVPPEHSVLLAGTPVPVDAEGRFAAEVLLPAGLHTVEVAVLDADGNGELFLRDLEFRRSDWFYVGIADLTFAPDLGDGPSDELQGDNSPFDPDSTADGRLAFYVDGRFGQDWRLTASADTREEPIEDLFSNFLDKSPESLFRRIDPDYHFPTFGDDGTVEETAPTSGKFYVKLSQRENHALWGNFEAEYLDNELAHVDRGLYGGNLHYQSQAATSFGEPLLALDGFAADPGTVPSREEFRGTGGSLYYLRRQDLLTGSERLRVEVRDKLSGLVTGVVHLRPTVDYDIDYLQGRILLTEPIDSTVADQLLVRSDGLSGNEAWLVVQYEYTPGFDDVDALSTGGRGHAWLGDHLKLGLTANRNEDDETESSLYAADVTARLSSESWLKLQAGRSEGQLSNEFRSNDGGFGFFGTGPGAIAEGEEALAWRGDLSLGLGDFIEGTRGRLSFYAQKLEAGYSAPGQIALTDTEQFGGLLGIPLGSSLELAAKADRRIEDDGLQTTAEELNLTYHLTEHWQLGAGVRHDDREDDSALVPVTQDEGQRTDAVLQVGFDTKARWKSYVFGQATLAKDGDRESNHRGGVGGAYRVSDRLSLDGEVSHGSLGPAVRLGTSFQQSEESRRYLSYALENERGYDGVHARRGNLVSGVRTRLSDSSSVYLEDRYQHGDQSTGLARAMGIQLAPSEHWTFGANWELGTLTDQRTHAETNRTSGGARVSYHRERLNWSSAVEYRFDDTEQPDGSTTDRSTWLFRNSLRFQMTPGGRVIGKLNHSFSESSEGQFFDGGFTEAVLGYAYRPVAHDRVHVLAKYTFFYNMPTTEQVVGDSTPVLFLQKSHVAAVDVTYDLTQSFSIGGKYAYRLGQVSLDREDPDFFDNDAHLFILRGDWRFLESWEATLEGRMLDLPDLDERKAGALFALYRYLGGHFKVGVGYNFTDFSEDLTDLSYDHHGVFFNLVGSL